MRPKWRFLDWTARFAHIVMQFQWEPRDLWVGIFWRLERWKSPGTGWDRYHGEIAAMPWSLHLYVCVLPMLPLHIYVMRTVRPRAAASVGVAAEEEPHEDL